MITLGMSVVQTCIGLLGLAILAGFILFVLTLPMQISMDNKEKADKKVFALKMAKEALKPKPIVLSISDLQYKRVMKTITKEEDSRLSYWYEAQAFKYSH